MGAFLDLASMNAALKELYDSQTVETLVYSDNPFLSMIKKNSDFGGKYKPIPVITETSQGASNTFANAQGNQTATQIQEFLLTRATDYSIATIDNQTMLASATDKMAFLNGAKILIDSAIRTATNRLASSLFRSGTGSIGRISGSVSTGVITLTNAGDVVQFAVGQVLQANATDGGATPRAALGYVIAVNRSSGTLTVSTTAGGAAASPGSWTGNDYLVVQGDNNNKLTGLAGWLPSTAPSSSDNFFGVNRSVDRVRLAGYYYDGSSQSIEEALIDSSALLAREGGRPGVFVTNFTSYAALEKALGAKVTYIDLKGPADIAFRGIMVNGANSTIKVFPDRYCQATTGYLLQMDTWALESLGDAPSIQRYSDGNDILRVYNADAGETRVASYCNLSCKAPGWNSQVALSA